MTLIGIDIGSSFIKGGVLDLDKLAIRDIVREPFPDPITGLPSGHFEIDPRAIVTAVERVVQKLLALTPDCAGVMFCGQMGGVILTDSRGEPVSNYLSWRDLRAATFFSEVASRLGRDELRVVGNELKPGSTTTLLCWLAEHGQLPARATPLDIGDFAIGRLCQTAPCFEQTQAIGLLDLNQRGWRHSAFVRLSIEQLDWPRLTDFKRPVGSMAWQGRSIPCYPCVGDQQAALAGTLLSDGELSLNVSTGSQVSRLTREVLPGEFQTRPFFDDWWLNTITHLPAGRSLDALMDLLTELPRAEGIELHDPWGTIARAAERVADSSLDVAMTFFAGSLGDSGRIDQITLDNLDVGHLFRAAFRGMAENYERCALRLSPERTWSRIAFSGGLAQKLPLLRDFIVERLALPFRMCPSAEDALFGLMVLGHVVTGRADTVADAISSIRSRCLSVVEESPQASVRSCRVEL